MKYLLLYNRLLRYLSYPFCKGFMGRNEIPMHNIRPSLLHLCFKH